MDLFQLHNRNKENGRTNPVISVSDTIRYILGVNNFSGKEGYDGKVKGLFSYVTSFCSIPCL